MNQNRSQETGSRGIAEAREPGFAPSRRYESYVLGLLFLVAVFNVGDRLLLGLLVDDIQRDIGLDDRQIGLMMGAAYTVVHFGAALPLANVADRYSRRVVISIGLVFWSAMTMFAGVASSGWQLVLSRMGVGLGEAAGAAPSQSLIADYVPEERRAAALSMVAVGGTAGMGFGMLVGGWVNQYWGWRSAFLVAGAPGVLVALLFYLTVREPPRASGGEVGESTAAQATLLDRVRILLAIPSYRLLIVSACLTGIAASAKVLWEPTFLRRVYGLDPGDVGSLYFLIYALPAAFGAYLGGRGGDRVARHDARGYAWLNVGIHLLAFPLSCAFLLLPSSIVVFGLPASFLLGAVGAFVLGAWAPQSMALVQMLAPPGVRTVAAALWSSVYALVGMGVGPYVVGEFNLRLEDRFGEEAVRYSIAIACTSLVIAAATHLATARLLPRDLARTARR